MFKYDRKDLIKQIAHHEGVVLKVYKDSLGFDTVGIGRNLKHRGIADLELAHLDKTMNEVYEKGITIEEAYFLADRDVEIVEKELASSRPIVLELDAIRQRVLVDMGFNMGIPRLNKFFRMWSAVNEQDYENAAAEMQDSLWAEQVKSRSDNLAYAMEYGEFA